ncbi:MAG: hypothetical protein MHM6MM_004887 [Cercozoa sp. M6MM]
MGFKPDDIERVVSAFAGLFFGVGWMLVVNSQMVNDLGWAPFMWVLPLVATIGVITMNLFDFEVIEGESMAYKDQSAPQKARLCLLVSMLLSAVGIIVAIVCGATRSAGFTQAAILSVAGNGAIFLSGLLLRFADAMTPASSI